MRRKHDKKKLKRCKRCEVWSRYCDRRTRV